MPLHIFGYIISPKIRADAKRWNNCYGYQLNGFTSFLYFLTWFPEFRNVVYKRMRINSIITPPISSLYITTDDIGEGLFIQHGFATIISAKRIGKNCWVNQQVTIGYNKRGAPVIGDNVTIHAGALVIGDITIGNNVIIGAGAIVVDDVPDGALICSPKGTIKKRTL